MPDINVNIHISGPCSMADLQALLPLLGDYKFEPGVNAVQSAAPPKAEKPAKAEKAAPAETKAEEPTTAEIKTVSGPTLDDVKAAMADYQKANSREALIELLAGFGLKQISALPVEQYGDFIAKCKKD